MKLRHLDANLNFSWYTWSMSKVVSIDWSQVLVVSILLPSLYSYSDTQFAGIALMKLVPSSKMFLLCLTPTGETKHHLSYGWSMLIVLSILGL
jgi:hypothetical protein